MFLRDFGSYLAMKTPFTSCPAVFGGLNPGGREMVL